MKRSVISKASLMAVAFSLSSPLTFAEQVSQVKGRSFVIGKNSDFTYSSRDKVKFYDQDGKYSLLGLIQKCNSKKCIVKVLKRRKGVDLSKGSQFFVIKPSGDGDYVAQDKSEDTREMREETSQTGKGLPKYAVKAGLGGMNSASLFAEFDYNRNEKWSFGFVVSNRMMGRDDIENSSTGFGARVDWHLKSYLDNGFLFSAGLGMASISYSIVNVATVSSFEYSETVPYFTASAAYKYWFDNFYLTLGGGFAYTGYTDSFAHPTEEGTTVSNPYPSMDIAAEASISYAF